LKSLILRQATRVCDNIEHYILPSQVPQAEMKKFFVEMARLKKRQSTGLVCWDAAPHLTGGFSTLEILNHTDLLRKSTL
jgi:hypothetical protein